MLSHLLSTFATVPSLHMIGAAASATEEAQPGLLDVNVVSALWVLVIFVVLVVILYKTAWKNVLAGLKAREARIRGDLSRAEEARNQAERMIKDHETRLAGTDAQIRDMIGKATADAERIAANIRAQAKAEGEAEREKARQEIETAKRDAIRQVYEQAADLATEVASKIIRRNLNPQDQQDLVTQALGQLQTSGANGR